MTKANITAAILNVESVDAQALLQTAARGWSGAGIKVAGVIASGGGLEGRCSAGTLLDIASGHEFSVALDAAPEGTSCHLDSAGMEAACAGLMDQIPAAEIVVLSKFGKLETMQRGLWAAFAAARASRKALLTTISARHMDAWADFASDAAWLKADTRAIEAWWAGIKQSVAPQGHRQKRRYQAVIAK